MADRISFKGYEVDPTAGIVYGRSGRPIGANARGYVKINHGRAGFYCMAHRLIWQAVHGAIPEGMQINHKNGVKSDNRLANLELVTPSANTKHAYDMGLACAIGDRNGRAIGKARERARANGGAA